MQVWALMRRREPEPVELCATLAEAEADLERVREKSAEFAELLSAEPFGLDETAPAVHELGIVTANERGPRKGGFRVPTRKDRPREP